VKVLVVVEDDPDVQFLVETIFSMDSRFTLAGVAASAEEALESLRTTEPEIIVLDHGLSGQLTGLDAAPRFKELAPQANIIMFTAHADLKARADHEPAIDGFVLKTEPNQLLPLAQRLTGLGVPRT
jgi:DNA-binding NarL/FixJ family response regulator